MAIFRFWLAVVLLGSAAVHGGEPVYVPGSTKKVCQLTGDLDRSTGQATLSQTGKRFGVDGTDLGSTLEHRGKLYFLFGDTHGRPGDWDAIAWTSSTDPERIVLDFHRADDGKWLPPKAPGISQGAFEIPSGGISLGGTMYVVFTTDHSAETVMGRSVLARSNDDGRTFRVLYDLSRDKFINVSLWRAGEWLYIFGSGPYRKSSVCLARVRPGHIDSPERIEFFAGLDAGQAPRWSLREADGRPLFRHDVVGEFSVAWLEPLGQYVMLYNASEPRGITLRSAPQPWGPWSEGMIVFDPVRDGGYGKFMHISALHKPGADQLSDPGREDEWGGEYGPYLMPRYTTANGGRCQVYFTMSTWNPYQVVVMRSELRPKAREEAR